MACPHVSPTHVLRLDLVFYGKNELAGVEDLGVVEARDKCEILGHAAAFDGRDGGGFESVCECDKVGQAIELSALAQSAAPGEDRGDRVRGCLLALEMAVVMPLHRAVGSLVFPAAMG